MTVMLKAYKVMLHPNNKQETVFLLYAKAARFAYNWALRREKENYKAGGKFLSHQTLRKEFTQLKKLPENQWLMQVDCDVTKQAIKDLVRAYTNFFKGRARYPKPKDEKEIRMSFYQDPVKLKVYEQHVKLVLVTGVGKATSRRAGIFDSVKLAEKGRIPEEGPYKNPRVTFDGLHWWISVTVEEEVKQVRTPESDGIGIDLGIKELAVCSDGTVIPNINKTEKLQKLQRKKKHLQRAIARKYKTNRERRSYRKSRNIIKSKVRKRKLEQRIRNLQDDHMGRAVRGILIRHPAFIALEDLNVEGMLKNHNLARSIQEEKFGRFRRSVKQMAEAWNTPVIEVSRWYASSKTCSGCGNIKQDLTLGDRTYECPVCGLRMDRDMNAAVNIREFARKVICNNKLKNKDFVT